MTYTAFLEHLDNAHSRYMQRPKEARMNSKTLTGILESMQYIIAHMKGETTEESRKYVTIGGVPITIDDKLIDNMIIWILS